MSIILAAIALILVVPTVKLGRLASREAAADVPTPVLTHAPAPR